jgi:hypothetical protein
MQPEQGIVDRCQIVVKLHQLLKSHIMQSRQYFVFVFEIKVYGRRAVFDEIGNFPDGDVAKTFLDEQFDGGIQDQFPDLEFLLLFSFLYSHVINNANLINNVNIPNFWGYFF